MTEVDVYSRGVLTFRLLTKTSVECSTWPTVAISAPTGTVILGGGGSVDWDACGGCPCPAGNMLTAMYPDNTLTTWTVVAKDHIKASSARVTAYCIVAAMITGPPISSANWAVINKTSLLASQPTMKVDIPGFTIVGGGARVNGTGSMLFESYPNLNAWVGSATEHILPSPATITVWAIGLKTTFLSNSGMSVSYFDSASSSSSHPKKTLVKPNFHLTGAGAKVKLIGDGNLLTASFPEDRQTVVAEATDHIKPNVTTVNAFAVGFL